MLHGDQYGRIGRRPGSRQQLSRFTGEGGNLGIFLYPYLWEDVCFVFDDFLGPVMNQDLWTPTADATATAFAILQVRGGMVRGTTGTTAGGFTSLAGAAVWMGDAFCGFEARLRSQIVTNWLLEFGFANAVTDKTLPVVIDVDTPAVGNGGTDLAVLHVDTSQTLQTMAAVTEGSTSGMDPSKTNLTTPLGGYTLTMSTWTLLRMQLSGDSWAAAVYENRGLVASASQLNAAATIEGQTHLLPWLLAGTRNTQSKNIDIDYLACWEDRP